MTLPNALRLPRLVVGDLVVALLAGVAGAAWLTWLVMLDAGGPQGWAALLTSLPVAVGFTLPAVLVAVPLTLGALRRDRAESPRSALLTALVCAPTAAAAMSAGNQLHLVLFNVNQGSGGLPIITMVGDTLTLLVVLLPVTWLLLALRALPAARLRSRARARARVALALGLGIVTALSTAALTPTSASGATGLVTAAGGVCPSGAPARSYDVQSINVNIPLNRFGDHDPKGRMYVLTSRLADVRAQEATQKVSIGLRDDPIQPLVIRANEGECLTISYTNNADGGDFGVHVDGLAFDVASSGDAIGRNPASSVAKGLSRTYTFYVPNDRTLEGAHYLHPGPGFRNMVNHGLFGSVVVEPPGSTYLDPNFVDEAHADAAQPAGMQSGWEATIRPAGAPSFRENVQLYHEIGNEDEKDAVLAADGSLLPDSDPHTESYRPDTRAINYRSEAFYDRLNFAPNQEAHAYASYTFGDPATPMPRGYRGDPTKFRILHAGSEMFHVFHMHGGGIRWRFNPVADTTYNYADTGLNKHPVEMSDSERLDSQAFGPGESYTLAIEGGAGGVQQGAGDFLFHCHIAEHYVSGMWSFWRVYDTRQSDFAPLADRAAAGMQPSFPVDSTQLIGKTFNGQTVTAENLDSWVRPQLPPPGIRRNPMDGAVWNWTTNPADPTQYLGETEDTNASYPDYYKDPNHPGHPTALPDDTYVGDRPVLLFNPDNGRPAYPMMRPHLGMRPPFSPNGHSGAPYLGEMANATASATTTATSLSPWAGRSDAICPNKQANGAPTVLRRFNVVAVQHSVQVTPNRTDPNGMVYVLAHDKAAILNGSKPFQPLALRTNVGECDAVTLTSELTDAGAANGFSQVNIHIHHVQFDTQASDGVITGMSYEQAVRPYKVEDPQLSADAAAGDAVLHLASVAKFQVGESIGVGLGTEGPAATDTANAGQSGQGPEIRTLTAVDPAAGTVTLSAPLTEAHPAGQWAGTEFAQYRWYPDVNLDNVFFHDHVDGINTWAHGLVGQLITEPKGSTYLDPRSGQPADSGTIVDIHTTNPVAPAAGVTGSFREMALWTMDKGFGATFDSMLNLRANPLTDRVGDPSLKFSSYTYGDPLTPLPRAYAGDPFVIRAISVAPTVDTLHVDGHTFGLENRYTDTTGATEGAAVDTLHYGISEKFSMILKGGAGGTNHLAGDYLYFNGIDRRITDGAWGIIRVLKGRVTNDPADPNFLQPLPGTTPSDAPALPTQTGAAPPEATSTSSPCPTGASPHAVSVTAVPVPGVDSSIRYAYVPTSAAAAVIAGTTTAQPLVLHVRAGECVSVAVTNQTGTNRISFHLAGLASDSASSGVDVGWNPESSIAGGATRTYTYFVDNAKVSGGSIADLGGGLDKRGLYGAYTVAPAGSTVTDPATGAVTDVGPSVDVNPPGKPAYRDFTLVLADDDKQIGASFMPYPVVVDKPASVRVNYQQAPRDDSLSNAFSSAAFGDPSTPLLTAYAGDPMVVHTLVAPGSEQMHALNLGGLSFSRDPHITGAESTETAGVGPWEMATSNISGGAGGTQHAPGDYFYGDLRRVFTAAGMWGLQRVLPIPTSCPAPGAGVQCLPAPSTAPGAPTVGPVTGGNGSAAIRWTAPDNGGLAITGYTVQVLGAATNTQVGALRPAASGATSLAVTGLVNGTSYRFRVLASNAVGAGGYSALSSSVTPATLPGAPLIGTPTRGSTSALVRWAARANGGSPITGYTVQVINAAGAQVGALRPAAPTATSLSVAGLVNGTAVRFRVRAANTVGTGAYSALSVSVTPARAPGVPLLGNASSGTLGWTISAVARWLPPTSNGGSAINGYVVTALRLNAAGAVVGSVTSAVRPPTTRYLTMTLAAGRYRFTIRASNAVGLSAYSPRSNVVIAR